MPFAVISDIHGNLEALEKVLEDIQNHGIDDIYCVGDIVGYGPDPKECIARAKNFTRVVRGNHDNDVGREQLSGNMNAYARESLIWTISQLDKDEKDYLAQLPYTIQEDGSLLAHSGLVCPEAFLYLEIPGLYSFVSASDNFNLMKENQALFVGHSHTPWIWTDHRMDSKYFEEDTEFSFGKKTIINVGSVGQPRDRDYRACWVECHEDKFIMHRTHYNYKKTQEKIRKSIADEKIADKLANRLAEGR